MLTHSPHRGAAYSLDWRPSPLPRRAHTRWAPVGGATRRRLTSAVGRRAISGDNSGCARTGGAGGTPWRQALFGTRAPSAVGRVCCCACTCPHLPSRLPFLPRAALPLSSLPPTLAYYHHLPQDRLSSLNGIYPHLEHVATALLWLSPLDYTDGLGANRFLD